MKGLIVVLALSGCVNIELVAHEEKHCAGWSHQTPTDEEVTTRYEWVKTREESRKPWVYLYVNNTDSACRHLGVVQTSLRRRIEGCAVWKPENCMIVLPK